MNSKTLGLIAALIVLAGLIGAGFGALHWRDASVVAMLRSSGTDAVARVEGGRRTNWKGAAVYAVELSWTDKSGSKRQAKSVPITRAYAKEVVRGDQFIALTVPIKYSTSETKLAPVITPDAQRLESALISRGDFWFWLGLTVAALGVALFILTARFARKS